MATYVVKVTDADGKSGDSVVVRARSEAGAIRKALMVTPFTVVVSVEQS